MPAALSIRHPPQTLRAALLFAAVFLAPFAHAQRAKDPLTPAQEEQVRNVADQPNERVKLFMKFIEDEAAAIHHSVVRPETRHPGVEIHDHLAAFTSLIDELQDNLDAYDESHSDIRKSLKLLLEHMAKWPAALEEPPGSPDYDFARKTALDTVETAKQTATDLLKSQEEYFSKHKPEKAPKKNPDE